MDDNTISLIRNWFLQIVPLAADALVEAFPKEELLKIENSGSVYGPIRLDLSDYGTQFTALKFHLMVVQDCIMLAISCEVRSMQNEPTIKFNHVFSLDSFADEIKQEDAIASLVNDLMEPLETAVI